MVFTVRLTQKNGVVPLSACRCMFAVDQEQSVVVALSTLDSPLDDYVLRRCMWCADNELFVFVCARVNTQWHVRALDSDIVM